MNKTQRLVFWMIIVIISSLLDIMTLFYFELTNDAAKEYAAAYWENRR